MKGWLAGLPGGHRFAAKQPTRRVCANCQGAFVGLKPLCGLCDRRAVIALPRRPEPDDEPPPKAA